MPQPYKILNLQGYFSCKTIEKISLLRRENFLYLSEGQLPPQAKSEMTPLVSGEPSSRFVDAEKHAK